MSIAAAEVSQSIFFAAAIIIAGFVPLFTLSGIEGHIFGPMAKTYAYAIAGGLIATFTDRPGAEPAAVPAGSRRRRPCGARSAPHLRAGARVRARQPAHRLLGRGACCSCSALLAVRSLGLEFLPKLEEGNLWMRATLPQSVSLEDSDAYVNRMRRLIARYPEVQTVVSQHGRPDDGTDATGFFNAEFFVPLEALRHLARRHRQGEADRAHDRCAASEFPGVEFNFSQYIQDNVEEAASGVKGENSVKVYGNDLETLEKTADGSPRCSPRCRASRTWPCCARSASRPSASTWTGCARRATGSRPATSMPWCRRPSAARAAGDLYEAGSDRHFPMMVRLAAPYRQSLDAIRRIPIAAPRRRPAAA